jgi:hypothetical protein
MRREFRRDLLDEMDYQQKRKDELEIEKARRNQKWLDGGRADPDDPVFMYVCMYVCMYVYTKHGWLGAEQTLMTRYLCMYACMYVCMCIPNMAGWGQSRP